MPSLTLRDELAVLLPGARAAGSTCFGRSWQVRVPMGMGFLESRRFRYLTVTKFPITISNHRATLRRPY